MFCNWLSMALLLSLLFFRPGSYLPEQLQNNQYLICSSDHEIVQLEPWGPDGIRVRCSPTGEIKQDWINALINRGDANAEINIGDSGASLRNGKIKANISSQGELSFSNEGNGKLLFKEKPIHLIAIPARSYKDLKGDLFHIDCQFEANDDEHFYGLGQHQHGRLDQKGCVIELIQRNTEVSIPFVLSSRGYGFLWNNPAIGRVELGYQATRWVAEAAPQLDYWVTVGDNPAEILSHYADVTGHAPQFPDWASGFWQSKLRYASQQELEAVVEEYRRRGLPLSVIVIDFFHWTRQGEWQFDPQAWPDPAGMVNKLQAMGVKVMVSVWPTVSRLSHNFSEMWHNRYIIRNKAGAAGQMYFVDTDATDGIYLHYYDATHPGARKYIWEKVKDGYYQYGIKLFWLDACEPEMLPFMPENLRFYRGDGQAVANIYPMDHVRGFHEGMLKEGEKEPFFLCRSAWAGSQRFGAALWSGDVMSTFASLKAQVSAGLNVGLSGIPWWNSDIGGFRGGDPNSPAFRELIIRWFQFTVFCPVFRLHGHRLPNENDFNGADNEVWSFGEQAYGIMQKYMQIRERLRPYIHNQMDIASKTGLPPMRPLFIDYPEDPICYRVEDQYLFGADLLVAPVLEAGMAARNVYLPSGCAWRDAWSAEVFDGGQWIEVKTPLDKIPLFQRADSDLPINK